MRGAIKSLMFIPILADCPDEERLLVAVITDKISLNEERISAVDEDELLDWIPAPEMREEDDVDDIVLVVFAIMHLFYGERQERGVKKA